MKAGFVRFLCLWLPPLLIFLTGLKRALLTGQADPWDWGLPMAVVLAATGALIARCTWLSIGWGALGSVVLALTFCVIAAGRAPDMVSAIGLLAVALFAIFGGALVRRSPFSSGAVVTPASGASRLRAKRMEIGLGAVLLMFAALILWRGPARPVQPVPDAPALAVITGLPLFWDETGRAGRRDAPIITVLRTRFAVVPMDDPLKLAETGAGRLLLAQPRALSPAQLVAIDAWVRGGGTALVLADPLLRWPSDLPLGDRRRAPSTSLLRPLLTHWGFRPLGLKHEEIRHRTPDGHLLTLSGVRAYGSGPDDWGAQQRRVGKGAVWLLGDADPIDDRLWLADPARSLDPRFWVADTPARVIRWLGGASVPGGRRWMREVEDVRGGIRWAILVGIIWAIMGAVQFRRDMATMAPGTKRESVTNIDRKSD